MTSTYTDKSNVQALSARMWSSGFLPARHAGIAVRGAGDPVLYLSDPPASTGRRGGGCSTASRRSTATGERVGDPETETRIAQYEMAFRMQSSVPELTDVSGEPASSWSCTAPKCESRALSPTTASWRAG